MNEDELKYLYPQLYRILQEDEYAKTLFHPLLNGEMNIFQVYETLLHSLYRRSEEQRKLIIQLLNETSQREKLSNP